MKRSSINLSNEDYKKIQAQAEKKSIALADYIRHLIQLGLKVEEAAEHHSNGHSNHSASLDPQKKLLTWELESRYLIRYLIQNGFERSRSERNAFLKEAKQKATSRVEAWLNAQNKAPHSEDH
jgi:hypothetical protein